MTILPVAPALASAEGLIGSPFAGMDICAAVGLRLPPGTRGPVFEQDVWDFTPVEGLPSYLQPSMRRMDFSAIANPRWRLGSVRSIMFGVGRPNRP
jgi:hypothetical protein